MKKRNQKSKRFRRKNSQDMHIFDEISDQIRMCLEMPMENHKHHKSHQICFEIVQF